VKKFSIRKSLVQIVYWPFIPLLSAETRRNQVLLSRY